MSRSDSWKMSLGRMVVVSAMLVLALSWASVAEAQQGGPPADEQYGNPAGSIGPTASSSGDASSGSSAASGSAGASGSAAVSAGATGSSESQSGGAASQAVSVLPDTGGPLLLLGLGGGAVLGAGMLLARQIRRS
jgi:hypothetical protein